MEQITILVESKEKVNLLSALLSALDFVKSVQIDTVKTDSDKSDGKNTDADFFSFEGIWKDRNIDLTTIRSEAWPRQS